MNTDQRLYSFVGADSGEWAVERMQCVTGRALPSSSHLSIVAGDAPQASPSPAWAFRGIRSNERYVTVQERQQLVGKQEGLSRTEATLGALILIRKVADWWLMTQEQRREIFEAQSKHIEIGLRYLPAVARRLHHCRDLGENEPFDFLTWFEYAPGAQADFDEMLVSLRGSAEWRFIDREVDVRVRRCREG